MSAENIKSWEIKPSTGKHFDALDGMRGIAILMVVCFHTLFTNPDAGTPSRLIGFLFHTGWMGVPVFFVLSGFLISYPFFGKREKDPQSWYVKGYVRRRLAKILPPYYLSILIVGFYYFILYSNPAYLQTGLQWALGLSNFIRPGVEMNSPYWSLLVEVHFYLLLPLLFLLFRGRRPRSVSWLIFLAFFFVPVFVRRWTWPAATVPKDEVAFLMFRFPCALDYFGWGILFAGFFVTCPAMSIGTKRLRYFAYAGGVLLAMTIGLHVLWDSRFNISGSPLWWSVEAFHYLPGLACFLLLFFLFDPDCAGSRFFSWSPLRFVGIVSYEWFLFHQPVVLLFRGLMLSVHGNIWLYLLRTLVPMVLTFVFSVAVYRYFSFPLLQWGRGGPSRGTEAPLARVAAQTTTCAPPTGTSA